MNSALGFKAHFTEPALLTIKSPVLLLIAFISGWMGVYSAHAAGFQRPETWKAPRTRISEERTAVARSIEGFLNPMTQVNDLTPIREAIGFVTKYPTELALISPVRDSFQRASEGLNRFMGSESFTGLSQVGQRSAAIKVGLMTSRPFAAASPILVDPPPKWMDKRWTVAHGRAMLAANHAVNALSTALVSNSRVTYDPQHWPFEARTRIERIFDGAQQVASLVSDTIFVRAGAIEFPVGPRSSIERIRHNYETALAQENRGVVYQVTLVYPRASGGRRVLGSNYTVKGAMTKAEDNFKKWTKLRRRQFLWEPVGNAHHGRSKTPYNMLDRYEIIPIPVDEP